MRPPARANGQNTEKFTLVHHDVRGAARETERVCCVKSQWGVRQQSSGTYAVRHRYSSAPCALFLLSMISDGELVALAVLYSRALAGMHAPAGHVEVHLANGLPSFAIAGCPKRRSERRATVYVPRYRMRASNFRPAHHGQSSNGGLRRSPVVSTADRARDTRRTGQIPSESLERFEFAGELALAGELRRCAARSRCRGCETR